VYCAPEARGVPGLACLEPESSGQISGRERELRLRYGWGEVTRLSWLIRPGTILATPQGAIAIVGQAT